MNGRASSGPHTRSLFSYIGALHNQGAMLSSPFLPYSAAWHAAPRSSPMFSHALNPPMLSVYW